MTGTSAAEILLPIWQRVLRRSSVCEHENFFDLGDTPSSAARLFADIAQAFGRDILPLMIYYAPTIKTLAALLEEPFPGVFRHSCYSNPELSIRPYSSRMESVVLS